MDGTAVGTAVGKNSSWNSSWKEQQLDGTAVGKNSSWKEQQLERTAVGTADGRMTRAAQRARGPGVGEVIRTIASVDSPCLLHGLSLHVGTGLDAHVSGRTTGRRRQSWPGAAASRTTVRSVRHTRLADVMRHDACAHWGVDGREDCREQRRAATRAFGRASGSLSMDAGTGHGPNGTKAHGQARNRMRTAQAHGMYTAVYTTMCTQPYGPVAARRSSSESF